ncbi:centrosomal protein of 152 kDa isoform X5 [Lacerta agilis]|uniref:centrosomal protein of 152 kDa isoform X5 n=1 Tax=Lacerta agilis TaxID=80427 RepID=UPI00141959E3|nr:centrosomal protein of 152 kDa isoform X5 [Lacerta agilis]
MYCTDVSVEIHSKYQNLTEGLEEQVHSIQDSLLQLQQLLTDLPHDMLEDSGDHLSDYSAPEDHEQAQKPWDQDANRWNDHPVATNPQSDYEQGQNLYADRFLYDQGNFQGEMHGSDWSEHHNEDEDKSMYEISGRASEDGSDEVYMGGDGFKASSHYQQDNIYHLPENFRPYTNGHQQEFSKQHSKTDNFIDAKKENLKLQCGTSETTVEPYKVVYKPYQNNFQQPVPISPDATRRNDAFEEMQQEFLGTGEDSPDNMQILQLQVLNKAKGRKLEELNNQLEERAQQIRYLSHQLAIVKDEKDGMCLSLQESQKLHQNAKEREIQFEGQIKALETQIQTLAANEEQLIKQSKVAEVAMEAMQQQLLELRRSDTLQRAKEQHEAIVTALKQKHEEQALSLQQKLDAKNIAFQEQSELCCNLREHVKQLERTLEESKLEKNEIISRLSRSLEESQNQCANLLQTGLVKETNQLRMQLQQAQSVQLISNEMNKALQEELKELKEELVLYESAAKHGVFLSDPGGELNVDMTDSYVDLGIKKKTGLNSAALTKEADKEFSKDEIILQLKMELERLLNSNKTKRNRISQLQNDLDDYQRTVEDLKEQLVKTNMHEPRGRKIENLLDPVQSNNSEEMLKLKKENQDLKQEIESLNARFRELIENQEKLKNTNQELCSQMRQMIQESDRDKQEALDRCERTYQQHYENMKKKLCEELEERHAAEREKLTYDYEMKITQLKAVIDELNKEMLSVKECYITVCRERDEQEATLKAEFEQKQQLKEEKLKKQLLEEKEESLNRLRAELEEEHRNSIVTAKSQWLKEKESDVKQHIENEVTIVKNLWEREQKEKHEVLDYNFKEPGDSCLHSSEGETGDKARPSMYNVGQQVELQRMLRKQTPLQESEMDLKCRKRDPLSREDICCEHCRQQLERKEKECQDLKKKLDKACKHLQLAVRAKSEQFQENEKIVEALMEENSTMKNKLDDLKLANGPPRSSSEGSVSAPCSCDGKALEEMRFQYIKAVGKIKSDMLRYIHESKERAAEIIKAEVLRERQETARKMRKYYLICLQQLLIDDGKHDGPEKKIICAAGKLATMANILETPVRNASQSKVTHSAQPQNSKLLSEVEKPQRNYMQQPSPTLVENQVPVKKPSNPTTQKRIPCSLRQQLDAETHSIANSHTEVGGRAFKQLDDTSLGAASVVAFNEGENTVKGQCYAVSDATFQNCSSRVSQAKLQNIHPTSRTGDSSDSRAVCVRFKNLNERPVVTELGCTQSSRHQKSTSKKTQVFDIQETPERDEGCSSDWSLVNETLHIDSGDVSLYPLQKAHSSAPGESHSKEDSSGFCLQPGGHKDKIGVAKSQDMGCNEGHLAMNPSCIPSLNVSKLSPADPYLSGAMCSTAGKSYSLLNLRKQTQDVLAFQQDSGFDSPQINFD